jgi:uncharacterized hydrophobic protein (TIGR00271 family)
MASGRRSFLIIPLVAGRRALRGVRAWLARSFDVPHDTRVTIVARMLEGHSRSSASYWLQLCVALALATLGLVLNGPAVVIGAMLVSPLMGPIVELGMGLAVGSALLSIRSVVRAFWSVILVVAGATLITAALPFHEVTGEIAARTSPTALDLLVAVFCALAAVFTTLRSGSDGASAAAGTAIAIALVPPLCVVGFGLGTAQGAVAQGAFLLFTANLCAILLVAVLSFWLFGFNLVDALMLERRRFEGPAPLSRTVRIAKQAFGSRFGTYLRLVVPIALVGVVSLPLSRALGEVSWEIRTRAQVQKIIGDLPLARSAVRSSVSLKQRTVHVALVVIGRPADARALEAALTTRIGESTGGTPAVEVLAVPDLETMEDVARTLARSELAQRPAEPALLDSSAQVEKALAETWPRSSAGELRRWRLLLGGEDRPTVEVTHLGPALGPSGESLLGTLLGDRLRAPLVVRETAIPSDVVAADLGDAAAWMPKLAAAVGWVRGDPGLRACVTLPELREPPPAKGRKRPTKGERARAKALAGAREAALAELAKAPAGQVSASTGDGWSVQIRAGSCEPGASP